MVVGKKRIRDYGIAIGQMKPGTRNQITDVAGVKVGHVTLNEANLRTGVTAILPHPGNLFQDKVVGAAHVINGFGKTAGTVQINELGTIETPILLTNTLSTATAADALIDYMLKTNPDIGRTTGTVNPVVGECNDMFLNDIRAKGVQKAHVLQAIEAADVAFEEGSVGAGTGMVAFGLKGGIGSASRIIPYPYGTFTIGVLVLANFGRPDDLRLDGVAIGAKVKAFLEKKQALEATAQEKGSIMMIVATDLPVTHRQLLRLIKRTAAGLARTGSIYGNGSGDIAIGFSTANHIPHAQKDGLMTITCLSDQHLDPAFHAVAEATEEAIFNALTASDTMIGYDGRIIYSFRDWLESQT